jgi:anti-anti-sigma regulatory factor
MSCGWLSSHDQKQPTIWGSDFSAGAQSMTPEPSASPIQRAEDQNPRHLAPTGDLTIFEAAEFKESLIKLFENDGLVSLDLSRVACVDTAAIQLMLAARKEERMLVSGISDDLQEKLKQLGFADPLSE